MELNKTEEYRHNLLLLQDPLALESSIHTAVIYFRKHSDIDEGPPIWLLHDGLVPILHWMLVNYYNKNMDICFEIAWILTNIAYGSAEFANQLRNEVDFLNEFF